MNVCNDHKDKIITTYPHSYALNTVESNENNFTKRQINNAKEARTLYARIGRPSHKKFLHILNNNSICDCSITSQDAKIALEVYRPDKVALKGKIVCSQPPRVPITPISHLPNSIQKFHSEITLCVDIFLHNF